MADNVRVEIGFAGGGATTAQLDDASCKRLLKAAEKGGDELIELGGEGGDLHVRVSQIAWIRVQPKESRVGF